MNDMQKKQFNYILWLVVLPIVTALAVLIAFTLIAYVFDRNEFQPDDSRGDDVLETGCLDNTSRTEVQIPVRTEDYAKRRQTPSVLG